MPALTACWPWGACVHLLQPPTQGQGCTAGPFSLVIGTGRCSCQEDFCQERTLLWACSHHPATLTRSECVAQGFQAACDFWRKLWQVTSLPGLPAPSPHPPPPRNDSAILLCVCHSGVSFRPGHYPYSPASTEQLQAIHYTAVSDIPNTSPGVHALVCRRPGMGSPRTILPG